MSACDQIPVSWLAFDRRLGAKDEAIGVTLGRAVVCAVFSHNISTGKCVDGGYTNTAWRSTGVNKSANKAFLSALALGGTGPTFGGCCDLAVHDKSGFIQSWVLV